MGSSAISHLAFSSDGAALAAVTKEALLVWRLDAQEVSAIPIRGSPSAIALSSGGRWLAAANFDILIFDVACKRLASKLEQEMLEGGRGEYEAIAFHTRRRDYRGCKRGHYRGVERRDTRERVRPLWSCECDADGAGLSSDAALVAFGTNDAHVLLWTCPRRNSSKTRRFLWSHATTHTRWPSSHGNARHRGHCEWMVCSVGFTFRGRDPRARSAVRTAHRAR